MNPMKINKININKGQYLVNVIDKIETNSIYFKTLTGIGATTLELQTPRNSIIVEPNVPVIDGKKGVGVLGVKEGITPDAVMQFMQNSKFPHKKLFTTPESFYKIMEAADILGINIYDDYFLLFDECDRLVKDVKFRDKIILPMNDFFKFKNKAMISATAVWPSDPRFINDDFIKQVIVPTFDYKQPINLIGTTNANLSLEKRIKDLASESGDEKFFIFFNSVKEPERIISQLKIHDESVIFCSSDASVKLMGKPSFNVSDTVIKTEFRKYNFLTSRFFSAMDINVDYTPHVIILSNVLSAPHSKIDPESEAIQIIGRLRNGVSSVSVISNIDTEIEFFSPNECSSYLKGCKECFETLETLHISATERGAKAAIAEALSLVSYANYLNADGSLNYYLIDQFKYEEKVKSYYKSFEALKNGYDNHYFNVGFTSEVFPLMDKHMDSLNKAKTETYKDRVNLITGILQDIEKVDMEMVFTLNNSQDVLYALESTYPEIVKAYRLLGIEKTNDIGYSQKALKRAIKAKETEGQISSYGLVGEIYDEFEVGEKLSGATIKAKLETIISKLSLDHLQPQIKLLERFFEIKRRNDLQGKEPKKYNLVRKKLFDKSEE